MHEVEKIIFQTVQAQQIPVNCSIYDIRSVFEYPFLLIRVYRVQVVHRVQQGQEVTKEALETPVTGSPGCDGASGTLGPRGETGPIGPTVIELQLLYR